MPGEKADLARQLQNMLNATPELENVRLRCPGQLMRSGLRRPITNLSNIGDGRGQLVWQVHHDIVPAA